MKNILFGLRSRNKYFNLGRVQAPNWNLNLDLFILNGFFWFFSKLYLLGASYYRKGRTGPLKTQTYKLESHSKGKSDIFFYQDMFIYSGK